MSFLHSKPIPTTIKPTHPTTKNQPQIKSNHHQPQYPLQKIKAKKETPATPLHRRCTTHHTTTSKPIAKKKIIDPVNHTTTDHHKPTTQNTHTKPTTIASPISTEQNQATDLIEREKESKPPNPQHFLLIWERKFEIFRWVWWERVWKRVWNIFCGLSAWGIRILSISLWNGEVPIRDPIDLRKRVWNFHMGLVRESLKHFQWFVRLSASSLSV